MDNYTLSVVMPNYNDSRYIGEALEAILSQSFNPTEVIVVDDGSTDNSVEIIEQFVKRYPSVRLLKNEHNMGNLFSANRGLENASGEYIYFASANDKILPGFFEKSMNLLKAYPQAGLCCARMKTMGEQGNILRETEPIRPNKQRYMSPDIARATLKRYKMYIYGPTVIYKTSAFRELGGSIPELHLYADWFSGCVISLKYGACFIPDVVTVYRIQKGRYSQSAFQETSTMINVCVYILCQMTEKYKEIFPDDLVNCMRKHFLKLLWSSLVENNYPAFMEKIEGIKSSTMMSNKLIRYCLKQLARMPRLLAFWYCRHDIAAKLDEEVNRFSNP